MMRTELSPRTRELVELLDQAVGADSDQVCCAKVKDALEEMVRRDHEFLDEGFLRPAPDRYARRLLYRDPQDRYSVLVMVWDEGQGTALHDHAGVWCVECVYKGRIQVVSYDLDSEVDGVYQFTPEKTIMAGVGEAGALIPPFEYHTIENIDPTPAITLHVYGGEMTWCHAFVPSEAGYRRERRDLTYTP